MATLKRLLIWLVESCCEATLPGALLFILAHIAFRGENLREDGLVHGLVVLSVAVAMMFFSTGYLLTTIIARLWLKPENTMLYPCIAAALYMIHFEILNFAAGGAFEHWERWAIRIVGPCIAFTCTLAGNQLLSKWRPSSPRLAPA